MAQNQNPLVKILNKSDGVIKSILQNPEKYELQIVYTQIDRDKDNNPTFTDFTFRVNEKDYFYPASTVKMPAAFLALEKINNLRESGIKIKRDTELKIKVNDNRQTAVVNDSTSKSGKASIEHYIKKIFLVSDNDAFNRLFEFLGADYINNTLAAKGIKPVKINHRLSVWGVDNTLTPPIDFYKRKKKIYSQKPQKATNTYEYLQLNKLIKGKAHFAGGKRIEKPMDFSAKNYYPLESMLNTLKRVIFPEAFAEKERFNLTKSDYRFLYNYMSLNPGESEYPKYDRKTYYDSYVKFFCFGDNKKPMPENIKIFNKVGNAYGYLIDCAYIVDFDTNAEFFLSAVVHVNENQTFNDNKYEYDEIGFPFMAKLGQEILKYEQKREREFMPNLKKFE